MDMLPEHALPYFDTNSNTFLVALFLCLAQNDALKLVSAMPPD